MQTVKIAGLLFFLSATLACSQKETIENLGQECPEWKALWISAPWEGGEFDAKSYDKSAEVLLKGGKDTSIAAPEFKYNTLISKQIGKATAYFCGLGFGELYINGCKVGNDLLSPNLSNYNYRADLKGQDYIDGEHFTGFHTLYMSYDVSEMLRKGDNEISALIGRGFYAKNYKDYPAFGTRRMICQIDIEYSDGSTESICSNEDWLVRKSSILMDDLFRGEVFDANYKGSWQKAVTSKAVETELIPQDGPSDKVMEILKPLSIEKIGDKEWRVDFGDYITGWTKIKNFNTTEGTTVEIVHECETYGNGTWRFTSDGSTWNWSPRFTWYAFRTITVKGWPGELTADKIEAEVVYSNMKTIGEFECSNDLLNKIHKIWRRTEADNLHLGTASDCPHREKRPYTGDGEVSCAAVMHTFDAKAFYAKWLRDIRDSQNSITGYIPNVAPWLGGGGGVPWGSAICIMTWEHYLHYGDESILRDNYHAMTEYARFLSTWNLGDGTIKQTMARVGETEPYYWLNLGEWCPPYNLAGENLIHTWYYWKCASIIAKTASILNKNDEADYYNALADDIKSAFHSKFYDEAQGSYRDASGIVDKTGYGTGGAEGVGDGSNIFALAMGVPEDRLEKVLNTVKEEFRANHGHFNTGIFGSSLLGETLCRYGLDEYVYEAMTKTDFPSFGYWIEQGAQTTWEQWNGKASRNHPMFGGALTWLYRNLAGLNVNEDNPGYRHILIEPRPVRDLKWVKYSTATPYGKVAIDWKVTDDGVMEMNLNIPTRCDASFKLPKDNTYIPIKSGHYKFEL